MATNPCANRPSRRRPGLPARPSPLPPPAPPPPLSWPRCLHQPRAQARQSGASEAVRQGAARRGHSSVGVRTRAPQRVPCWLACCDSPCVCCGNASPHPTHPTHLRRRPPLSGSLRSRRRVLRAGGDRASGWSGTSRDGQRRSRQQASEAAGIKQARPGSSPAPAQPCTAATHLRCLTPPPRRAAPATRRAPRPRAAAAPPLPLPPCRRRRRPARRSSLAASRVLWGWGCA